MNYSDNPASVRVDFFRPSGKWYTTEAVRWLTYNTKVKLIHEAFKEALVEHLKEADGTLRLGGMTAVCLDPWHENAHPQMTTVPERV